MDERNLPVRLFKKREEVDDRSTEPGGKETLPKWTLKGEELQQRVLSLTTALEKAKQILQTKTKNKNKMPAILKAEIIPNASAKTHRKKISDFFDTGNRKSDNITGLVGSNSLLVKIENEDQINYIEQKLRDCQIYAHAISAIQEVESFKPIIELPEDLKQNIFSKPLKVKLINYNDKTLNTIISNEFEGICDTTKEIHWKSKTQYTKDLIVYKITVDSFDALDKLKEFDGLFSIEPMPSYEITLDCFDEPEDISIKYPQPGQDYPIVGVLDTGIEEIPHLRPWIIDKKHTNYTSESINKSHGTFVSGIIVYGDDLEDANYTGLNGCMLFDATVCPDTKKEKIDQDDLIDNIREAVRKNCSYIKVWNLSLGTNEEAFLDKFSDFGIALDSIQDEYNIIISKSTGNCKSFQEDKPNSRIAQSADSVRSVVVGSLAQSKTTYDKVEKNYPSPFTRIGPGPSYIIKPDLVHYGGNAGMNNGKLSVNGVKSFAKDGDIVSNCGTSFSTPRIASIMAGLQYKLDQKFDPLLIKALLIHSASYPQELSKFDNDKIKYVGYGVPNNINNIVYNSPTEITLILRDRLEKGKFIEILDFPYPQNLVKDGFYYGQVVITVVANSILESSQSAEYCQSNIDVLFGTYENKTLRDTTQRTIKNPIGRSEESINFLNKTHFSKKQLKNEDGEFSLHERLLIQYKDKFHPIKKYAIDLEELKPAEKDENLVAPKNWYLKITGLYREFIEKKALKEKQDLFQDFCIIITIKDPEDNHLIYNEVTQLLNQNNFFNEGIKLKQDVNVNVNNPVVNI